MMKFIKALECPNCGELVQDDGSTIDFTAPDGVVNLNLFSLSDFHCGNCGAYIYTGDIDDCIMYEEPDNK